MKNSYKILLTIILSSTLIYSFVTISRTEDTDHVNPEIEKKIKKIWDDSEFKDIISFDLFRSAMTGYYKIDLKKKGIITIIDYSKLSTEKRFYVLDIERKKLLYRCLVAHGKNTGNNKALYFSNEPNSKKSSLGFYITAETYIGKHGYSLKIDGIEKGINDNARKRSIVIHGADYVSQDFIIKQGRLGRSWGCPALPKELSKEIIDLISRGTCIFIFGNDNDYLKKSKYIKNY